MLSFGTEPFGKTYPIIGYKGPLRRDEHPGIAGSPAIQRPQSRVVFGSFSKLGGGFVVLRNFDQGNSGPAAPLASHQTLIELLGVLCLLEAGLLFWAWNGPRSQGLPSIPPNKGWLRTPWRSSIGASSSGAVACLTPRR